MKPVFLKNGDQRTLNPLSILTFHSLTQNSVLTIFLYWYKLRFCLVDLSTSRNTVGPLVTSCNFDGGPINKQ